MKVHRNGHNGGLPSHCEVHCYLQVYNESAWADVVDLADLDYFDLGHTVNIRGLYTTLPVYFYRELARFNREHPRTGSARRHLLVVPISLT